MKRNTSIKSTTIEKILKGLVYIEVALIERVCTNHISLLLVSVQPASASELHIHCKPDGTYPFCA